MTDAQGEQVIGLLTRILEALTVPLEAPQCSHPDEARTNMSSMGETEWVCRACGLHYGPVRRHEVGGVATI